MNLVHGESLIKMRIYQFFMSEYWVEENIRPLSHRDSDRLLIEDLEPIVNALKQKGIISWHFLREGEGWKGSQNVKHIRLRFKADNLQHLKKIRRFLKRKLDILQQNGVIVDHYVGKHGKPVRRYRDYYQGESRDFDEQVTNPKGWNLVEGCMEIGSEMALLLIKGRMNRIQLGPKYNFYKISHLFPNQCRHYPFIPLQFPLYRQNWSPNWVIYDVANPSP